MEDENYAELDYSNQKTIMEEIVEEMAKYPRDKSETVTKQHLCKLLIEKLKQTEALDLACELASVTYDIPTHSLNWKFRLL